MNSSSRYRQELSKYKISRRGKKLQVFDIQRLFQLLPKDVSERSWADLLEREENDLMILELREEIFDEAFNVIYAKYMERQTVSFTAYCTENALRMLINWLFYRHDPGEENNTPKCYIPHRAESWMQDQMPSPCPLDTWGTQDLDVIEGSTCDEEQLLSIASADSITFPFVMPIPKKYWFPGKVCLAEQESPKRKRPDGTADIDFVDSSQYASETLSDRIAAENEVLQKVTDYSTEKSKEELSSHESIRDEMPAADFSLDGAGDSRVCSTSTFRPRAPSSGGARYNVHKSRSSKIPQYYPSSRLLPRDTLPSISSACKISGISDCFLRNLRLETFHEVSSEKLYEQTPRPEKFKKGKK